MSNVDISDPGHGHSPAAWSAVIIMIVAFIIATFAFWFVAVWLVWVAVGILVLGPIVGWILAKAGYGIAGPRFQPKQIH